MSYSGPAGYNQQLKLLDIQAIQAVCNTVDAANILPGAGNLLPLP